MSPETEMRISVACLNIGDSFEWCGRSAYITSVELSPYKPRTAAHANRIGRGGRWLHVTIPEREDLRLHYYDDEWVTAR